MDDLNQQIQNILSDPQAMGQLQGLLRSLGGGQGDNQPQAAPASSGPDLSSLLGALGGGAPQPAQNESSLAGVSPQALSMMTRLMPLLSQANREDDATRLLRALRPLLGEQRQKRWTKPFRSYKCCVCCPC